MLKNQNIQLGIAPIGWTNDDMPSLGGNITFEQSISEMALSGFEGTEVGGKFPTDLAKLTKALNLRDLKIASQWFSTYLCTEAYESTEKKFIKQLDFLEKLDASRINVCELSYNLFASKKSMFGDNKPVASDKEWDLLCNGLNKLGKIAKDRGFKLCYHHHMATVVQTIEETERLMNNTNSEYVYLCFDTGHFKFSEENVLEAAELFKNRIGHVHLKDIRSEKMKQAIEEGFWFRKAVVEGCFTVPGDGNIDFESFFNVLNKNKYEGWLIVEAEQDPRIANPLEYALKARQYIKNKTSI